MKIENKATEPVSPVISIMLIIAAVVMVCLGFVKLEHRESYIGTSAVISSIETEFTYKDEGPEEEHTVHVSYTVGGQTYESVLGYYDFTMNEGDTVEILYDPDNPEKIQESGAGGVYAMFAFGGVCAVLGVYLLLYRNPTKKENYNG